MGTDRTDYVIVGAKLPFGVIEDSDEGYDKMSRYEDNGYKQDIEEYNGLSAISDGMCGNYMFVGKILAKAIEENGGGLPIVDCEVDQYKKDGIKEAILKHWGHLLNDEEKVNLRISVYAFTHYH